MEQEQELRALPDRPPRQCPVCGARVAEGAKTCLMCGASLEEEISIEETPPVRRLTQRQLLILGGVALIILALAVIMGLKLSTGGTIPTLTPTVTHTPTLTQTPSVTPTPTITPSPLPTATPIPPQSYTVQEGDTLLSIAVKFDLTTEEIKAYNGLTSDIIVEGDAVLIPPATPTPGPTPTLDPMLPTPTYAPFILHTVKSGDTLSTIAEEYNVNVSDIQAANNIEPGFTMIQAGNVLEIPQYTPTPTPIVEEVIAGEESADQTIYTPPTLLYPRNGEVFTGTQSVIMLQWAATGILDDQEYYRVAFTASTAEGPETTYTYVRTTSWRVPSALLPPPETAERTCTWTISTVQQRGTEADPTYAVIGEAKDSRIFLWNTAQP